MPDSIEKMIRRYIYDELCSYCSCYEISESLNCENEENCIKYKAKKKEIDEEIYRDSTF